MSVISIRPSSTRLQNLGGTIQPNRMQHFVSPRDSVADKSIVPKAIGDLAQTIQQSGGRMFAAYLHYKRTEDNVTLAEAGADYQQRLRDGFMNAETGLMTRTGDAIENLDRDTDEFMKTTLDQVCEDRNLSGRMKELFEAHVNPVTQSWQGHMANHILSETTKLKRGAATANREATYETWQQSQFDPQLTAKLISDYEHERSEYGDAEEVRNANVRKFSQGLAADMVLGSIRSCLTEADFDERINRLKTDPDSFYRDNEALYAELGAGALSPKTVEELIEQAKQKKDKSVLEQTRQLGAEVDALISKGGEAEAKGLVEQMDEQIAALKSKGEVLPDGSKVRLAAFQAAAKLEAAADTVAKRQTWEAIVDHAGDPVGWSPPKGSRMAKFYKTLKESYDRQVSAYTAGVMLAESSVVQEERKANEATLRASMLNAAAVDPGGFSARLAEAAEKGHITLDQYRKIRDEFRDVWMKEGMPQKGAALVQILKNEFYADRDYDLNDRLAVNPKTGRFEYAKNPDTKKPFEGEKVEFETTDKVPVTHRMTLYGSFVRDTSGRTRTVTTKRTLTSDEQLKMLDWAVELAQHDEEWISTDPQTGAKLDKPRKLNAAAELQDACSRLKRMKQVQSSQDMVEQRANAMLKLRAGFAQADDAVTDIAAKREAAELHARENLKAARRKPFAPKMPGGSHGENATSEGEED